MDQSTQSAILDPHGDDDDDQVARLGFKMFHPPPLLTRHPTPYIGRDDNIDRLREILDDILECTGKLLTGKDRILCAPDHKIANNLFTLMKQQHRYKRFLPEFPLLHLRKSKITTLISGYDKAGLKTLIRYIQDTNEPDFSKVLRSDKIDKCTQVIRRLASALNIVFFIKFLESLPKTDAQELESDMRNNENPAFKWSKKYFDFFENGKKVNATFALHADMLLHCEEILAVAMAERIGGPDGYLLLLAAVKSSLRFSFLNGASSYAGFCTQLLVEHHSSGCFHQNMKETLFTTPFKNSSRNFGLDTQREMDHRIALKGFRQSSTVKSILPRMSLIDTYDEQRERFQQRPPTENETDCEEIVWQITEKDLGFIIPTAKMILKVADLSSSNDTPFNFYTSNKPLPLPPQILDRNTQTEGSVLIKRFLYSKGLMGITLTHCNVLSESCASTPLGAKIRASKGVTVRRMSFATTKGLLTTSEKHEKKRLDFVKKETKKADCFSSEHNTCQAILHPDGSKPDTNKASGIKNALIWVITEDHIQGSLKTARDRANATQAALESLNLVYCDTPQVPRTISSATATVVVDFSGVKFKTFVVSGDQYVTHVQDHVIHDLMRTYSNLDRIVLVEEKYSFTPNDLKAATRLKRQKDSEGAIAHLKDASETLTNEKFDRTAITTTEAGKRAISVYLAEHMSKMSIMKNIEIDLDCEYQRANCHCPRSDDICGCASAYAVPRRFHFSPEGFKYSTNLEDIQQRKGEAEMSVVDWVLEVQRDLKPKQNVVSLMTSGDVDALPIHLFAISHLWPRSGDGSFMNDVFVVLAKPKGMKDVYDITGIVTRIEQKFGKYAAMHVAVVLCMGGNDFLPKFHGITHMKLMQTVVVDRHLTNIMQIVDDESGTRRGIVDTKTFQTIVKTVYCPSRYDPVLLTIEEVRQLTIKDPKKADFNHDRLWMPPQSALQCVLQLIQCQVDYLFTAGKP